MDKASFYNDFISYINENMVKVQELLEKVTIMHYETTKILLETCTLFNPQILIELNEIEGNGRKYDDYILIGQDIKTRFNELIDGSHNNVNDYRQIIEEIEIIDKELNELQESHP